MSCCMCGQNGKWKFSKILSKDQFRILFKSNHDKLDNSHTKRSGKRLVQTCICHLVPIQCINVSVLDITLANVILTKCENIPHERGVYNWLEQIVKARNALFHLTDLRSIDDNTYNYYWNSISGSVEGLSNLVGQTYNESVKNKVNEIKRKFTMLGSEYMEENLCREYWREKCVMFEKNHRKDLSKYEELLESITEENPRYESHQTCRDIMQKIVVDDIIVNVCGNATVRTVIESTHLNSSVTDGQYPGSWPFEEHPVPPDWDTAKLVDSIEVMCEQYTSDMPVKITSFSTEDIEILATIWRIIMTKAGCLQKEIRRFIHELVTLSGIQAPDDQLDINIIMDEEETKREFSFYFKAFPQFHQLFPEVQEPTAQQGRMQNDFETNDHNEQTESEDPDSKEPLGFLNKVKTRKQQEQKKYTLESSDDNEQTETEDQEREKSQHDQALHQTTNNQSRHNDPYDKTVLYNRTTQNNSSNQLEIDSTNRQNINNYEEERSVNLDLKKEEIHADSKTEKPSEKKQSAKIAGNKPTFTAEITNTTGKLNETVQLICRTENVKQRVEWYFNGQLIYDSDPTNYRVVNHTDGTRILKIPKLQDRHNGIYMCEACNEFGATNMKAYITVLGSLPSEDPVGRPIFQIDRRTELSALPVISRGILMQGNIILLLSKKKLFKYHILDCMLISEIDLQSESHDLAVINESIIAVTVPETIRIELHNVVDGRNNDVRYINTDFWCYAISVTTNDYVVVCMNSKNKGLKFMNIRDKQSIEHMHNMKVHKEDGLYYSSPYLYYTNYTNKCIACYSDDRQLHFTFEDKPFPFPPIGMTIIDKDTLYIVCETAECIWHASISKKRHKAVESGFESVVKPCVFLYSDFTRNLFILDYTNNLFVYEKIQSYK
ncbi:TTN [Mytilus coruscus]|uniref:TTN n=1 Tax=Mytilus coruscus TaxID=42192 RepID=A0A6J8C0V6_MYTCO|nr:TTN [Mytilus coruscus]